MNPTWESDCGRVKLWNADCLKVLPTLGKVDAVVTDVPYEISQKSNGLRRLDYGEWDGAGATSLALAALGILKQCPSVIAWCDWRQLSAIAGALPGRSERALTWAKPNPPVLNGQSMFLSATEHAFYGKLPAAWFAGGCVKSYWIGPPPINRKHPTQKPVWLMAACVSATVPPEAICIDPFMGSASTGVAAVRLGRKFLGIELDPGYFEISRKRIVSELAQGKLFEAEPEPKPQQLDIFGGAS